MVCPDRAQQLHLVALHPYATRRYTYVMEGVYAQVRDAAPNESNSMYKRVTCN